MRITLLLAALIMASPLLADSNMPPAYWADRQLPDARQEARADALMQELRCLVCQGQSIADSNAEIAGDMRDLVRRRIAAGQSPAQVRNWLIHVSRALIGPLSVRNCSHVPGTISFT